MAVSIVLLRGINLGPSNRIAMPALREALAAAGFENPRTYVQSGNIVLTSGLEEPALSDRVEQLIAERFGFVVPAVVRSAQELTRLVARNPFPELARQEPKRLQVTFFHGHAAPGLEEQLRSLVSGDERVAVGAREIYAWHPDGVARSKLATRLAARTGLGKDVVPTSRNWTTVLNLLKMATSDAG